MKKATQTQSRSMDANKKIWAFTPSRTDPKDLEFILVQRHKLLEDAVERVKESATTDHKHHLLFVGPRGSGKTHLLTLIVSRLGESEELEDRLRIAWLNEDETCTTLLEFLLKVHAALERRYPLEYHDRSIDAAYEMKLSDAREFVSTRLIDSLGDRTLLIATENLDAVFKGLKAAGQKQLRAYIQENSKLSIVATAQRLVEDLSRRTSPFFGFFQTDHLKPLDAAQATELLKNIAQLYGHQEVVEFLCTARGRSRMRALHHLSGGNHRIYIVLSQFINGDTIDALLGPFMKMVDELTPYYQERIRWLSPLQRKIVEYLCSREETVRVKEIAKRLFATHQTISSQLQDLREKGYVEANQRGREVLYEISEPLMRICVEVKENQSRQPLRLLVDFLRVWYDENELNLRLGEMEVVSESRRYIEAAIRKNSADGNLRKRLFLKEIQLRLPQRISALEEDEVLDACERLPETAVLAVESWYSGDMGGAERILDEALGEEVDISIRAELLLARSDLYSACGQIEKAIADLAAVIGLAEASVDQVCKAFVSRGILYDESGDLDSSIEDFTSAIDVRGASTELIAVAIFNRGVAFGRAGNVSHEISDYSLAIELSGAPADVRARAHVSRGIVYSGQNDTELAIADFTAVAQISGAPVELVVQAVLNRGIAFSELEKWSLAIADFSSVLGNLRTPGDLRGKALFNRGIAHEKLGEWERAVADYTYVIHLPDAAPDRVARTLINRGAAYNELNDFAHAFADYTAVIELPGISRDQLAMAFFNRGILLYNEKRHEASRRDFEAVADLPQAPKEMVVDGLVCTSELLLMNGNWTTGFRTLRDGLERGTKAQPFYYGDATDLVGVVFSAGLGSEDRHAKVGELLGIYAECHVLPVLGETIVKHIGRLFRAGSPFPASDNLENWARAWERAAEDVAEFRLSLRLIRKGVDFLKSGGTSPEVLLDLTSTERLILEQAFGIA